MRCVSLRRQRSCRRCERTTSWSCEFRIGARSRSHRPRGYGGRRPRRRSDRRRGADTVQPWASTEISIRLTEKTAARARLEEVLQILQQCPGPRPWMFSARGWTRTLGKWDSRRDRCGHRVFEAEAELAPPVGGDTDRHPRDTAPNGESRPPRPCPPEASHELLGDRDGPRGRGRRRRTPARGARRLANLRLAD